MTLNVDFSLSFGFRCAVQLQKKIKIGECGY